MPGDHGHGGARRDRRVWRVDPDPPKIERPPFGDQLHGVIEHGLAVSKDDLGLCHPKAAGFRLASEADWRVRQLEALGALDESSEHL
jgi:hypothetical protein